MMESQLVQVRQSKYSGNFQSKLETSREFVNLLVKYLCRHGLLARAEDDSNPFLDMYGNAIRLWDIMCIDPLRFSTFYVEAKDYPRCLYYDITGLPQKYIDERMMYANQGKDIYLIFRDNIEWVEQKAKKWGKSSSYIIDQLVADGFAKRKDDKVAFVPYGNNLSFLMRTENQQKDLEGRIKSKLSRYNGDTQYLWKISSMKPIEVLLKEYFPVVIS